MSISLCMVFSVLGLVLTILDGFVVVGVDVGEILPMEAARKKTKKKSKRGVYRPKIQIDVVFKRSTEQAVVKRAEVTPKKKYTRKKKIGKRVEDAGDGEKDDLMLACENNSTVEGVGGDKIEGVGVFSCMEGVVLATESYVPFPEIGGVVEVKKVEGEGEKVGIRDDTPPPPVPLALEWKFPRTYVRRRGLNAKRCLDFGSGKEGIDLGHVCESLGKFELPLGKTRGEVIVEDGGREEGAMVASTLNYVAFTRKPASTLNHVAFTRKPRTK